MKVIFVFVDDHSVFARILIVSTGLSKANIPDNLAGIEGYESVSVNSEDYEAKNVLILGKFLTS